MSASDTAKPWRTMKVVGIGDIALGAVIGAAGLAGFPGEDSFILIILGGGMVLAGAAIALLGRYKLSQVENPAGRRG